MLASATIAAIGGDATAPTGSMQRVTAVIGVVAAAAVALGAVWLSKLRARLGASAAFG